MTVCPTPQHAYSARDWRVVDYACEPLEGSDRLIRGPAPASLQPGSYIACLGAAQTFGCFCERPFPRLLAERLDFPTLNLGFGGAGPEYFLRRPALLGYARRARLVVLQTLSGRSAGNSVYSSGGDELLVRRADGAALGADAAYAELLRRASALEIAGRGRRLYLGVRRSRIAEIVEETRADWTAGMQRLIDAIEAPVVLLWWSKRRPAYRPGYWTVQRLFGDFPQFVDQKMIRALRPHAAAYVECVTRRGSPQPLIDRFTGGPASVEMGSPERPDLSATWTENAYYPSPEMHQDVAAALEPVCRPFLSP